LTRAVGAGGSGCVTVAVPESVPVPEDDPEFEAEMEYELVAVID